jgi:hypothetical protein
MLSEDFTITKVERHNQLDEGCVMSGSFKSWLESKQESRDRCMQRTA